MHKRWALMGLVLLALALVSVRLFQPSPPRVPLGAGRLTIVRLSPLPGWGPKREQVTWSNTVLIHQISMLINRAQKVSFQGTIVCPADNGVQYHLDFHYAHLAPVTVSWHATGCSNFTVDRSRIPFVSSTLAALITSHLYAGMQPGFQGYEPSASSSMLGTGTDPQNPRYQGRIPGKVLDGRGRPVSGASVWLWPLGHPFVWASTRSVSNGEFWFRFVHPDIYYITASMPGFGMTTPQTVQVTRNTGPLTLRLTRGTPVVPENLLVMVLDRAGKPQTHLHITVAATDGPILPQRTDRHGWTHILLRQPGVYQVRIKKGNRVVAVSAVAMTPRENLPLVFTVPR